MATKTWGDYEVFLDQVLGRGGMGAVYKGRQISVNRPVAIKVLKKDLTDTPEFVQRFQREAALLAKLVDSHVVQIFGAGEADEEHFYAMEYVEGEDLATKLKRGHRFTPEEVIEIGIRTGKALQAAWKQKIVHRDIKPSNIIVTSEKHIKVMDFGLAKNPENDLTRTELIMGTAKYMSPEQATASECDIRSDLYSLGAVLYELATGSPPFVGESPTAVIYQHVHKAPVPPSKLNASIPNTLEAVILRLMAKQPQQRYQTPEELIADLKAISEGVTPDERTILYGASGQEGTAATGEESASKMPEVKPAGRAGLYASLAAVAVILGLAVYFIVNVVKKAPTETERRKIANQGNGGGQTGGSGGGDSSTQGGSTKNGGGDHKTDGDGDGTGKTVKPEWEIQYEELLHKGDDALSGDKKGAAVQHWEAALEKLPADDSRRAELTRKIGRARCDLFIEEGQKTDDPDKAISSFMDAEKWTGDDASRKDRVARLLRQARLQKYEKLARSKMGSDWESAADDFKRAIQNADEGKEELEALEKFCRDYDAAIKTELAKKWDDAMKAFQTLLEKPRGFEQAIQLHLDRIRDEMAKEEKTEIEKRAAKFGGLWDEAKKDMNAARWADARAKIDAASVAEYSRFVTDEFRAFAAWVKRASSPPEGMRYVTAGKFRMGGGTREEGPEGNAEVAEEYYIDTREVTTGDYAKFLAAIEKKGHHDGCHLYESPQHSHVPDRWTDQKPGEPVVGIDWWDAYSYAKWAGKRLPTEAEWERAARYDPVSGKSRIYPWGDEYRKEGGASAFGCEGMDKKILEWTDDWFKAYSWSSVKSSDFGEKYKVLRGGYKVDPAEELKAFHRNYYKPDRRERFFGIRCVKSANP